VCVCVCVNAGGDQLTPSCISAQEEVRGRDHESVMDSDKNSKKSGMFLWLAEDRRGQNDSSV